MHRAIAQQRGVPDSDSAIVRAAMSTAFKTLHCALCLVAWASAATAANEGLRTPVRPSDCRPRDADSTCATAVAGAPMPPPFIPNPVLYDGPLGGVPATGYAYWGFDFLADETGTPSPVRPDEFINRSSVPVTITLSFNIPTGRSCGTRCLPGMEFEVDEGFFKIDPPFVVNGNTVTCTHTFMPGRGYGWVIALWQSTNPRLTVTIPQGAVATLPQVGLSPRPSIVTEIPATAAACYCWDGSSAACSEGNHFSNGLLGSWSQEFGNYTRAGAFNSCPAER
jgi:hypothetical protein